MIKLKIKKDSFRKMTKRVFGQTYFPSLIALIILLIVNAIIQPEFFTYNSFKTNVLSFSPVILISMAQGIIILSGGIDLSVGSAMSLCAVVAAALMTDSNVLLVVLLMFALAVFLGLFNGLIVGKISLPPLISTYASSAIFFGISMWIMPTPGGYVPEFFYKLYYYSILNFIPVPLVILIIAIIIWIIISKTTFYRYIYAVGGNPDSAFFSGIKVSNVKVMAHVVAGIFVGFASLMMLMSVASGDPRAGLGNLLNSIAACVIGGLSMKGGKGSIVGPMIGAIILGLLIKIVFYSGASSSYQSLFRGLMIVITLSLAYIPRLREERYKL